MNLKNDFDLLMKLESISIQSFDECNCYKNIILTNMLCHQPAACKCPCIYSAKTICLNRTMEYDLLQLQKAHAGLHKDSTMVAKVDRKINAFESREFKRELKLTVHDKIVTHAAPSLRKNDRRLTSYEKIVVRRTMEEKLDLGRCAKLVQKRDEKRKSKEVRKKTVTQEIAMAEIEFEKALLKKLENEEKRRESSINKIKPKKKGPKTHFRKSKKPGRA